MAKILIVDDNTDMLDTLEHLFMLYDFEVLKAVNGELGVQVATTQQPKLIILDALMPVMNGFDACTKLKNSTKTRDIPVIFLSANYTEEQHRSKGLKLGADDYILKPFNAKELITKVNSLLRRKQITDEIKKDNWNLLQKSRNQLDPRIEVYRKKAEDFENSLIIDHITGVYNSIYFVERLEDEIRNSLENQHELTMLLLDVDSFEKVNQTYGEKTGNYLLMKIANVILHNSRASDIVFRVEKNKFGIVLLSTGEPAGFYEAEKIRSAIVQTQFFDQDIFELKRVSYKRKQDCQQMTVSIGIKSLEEDSSAAVILKQTQEALNLAKSRGRNNTVRYSEISSA